MIEHLESYDTKDNILGHTGYEYEKFVNNIEINYERATNHH